MHQIIFNSYADKMFGTITCDPDIVDDGNLLGECLKQEIEELKREAVKHSKMERGMEGEREMMVN